MAWYDEAIFYHIYPFGLTNSPKENNYGEVEHRLNTVLPWISHIKEIAGKYNFATDMKAYKENPTAFKGNVSDVAKVLRVLITGRDKTPDLFEIMKIMGIERVKKRLLG